MGSKIDLEEPVMVFEFNKFIKTTKSRYAYQELEFLAEFGGYVGLFLGKLVINKCSELLDLETNCKCEINVNAKCKVMHVCMYV